MTKKKEETVSDEQVVEETTVTTYENDDDTPKTAADVGAQEVTDAFNEANRKGYFGTVPDPHPNEAYSLETDPLTSPGMEDTVTRAAQHSATPIGEQQKDA